MLFTAPDLDERELAVLEQIRDLRTQLGKRLHEQNRWFGPLRRMLEAEAVRASTAIEGFDVALDDSAAIRDGEEPLSASHENAQALRGYSEAMTYVLQLARQGDVLVSTQLLSSLHFMMTNYDLQNRPGLWRVGAIFVRDSSTEKIVYEGPDVDQVPRLLDELVHVLTHEQTKSPIVDAAMAHLNLVMIHPFQDGNGRMARCLQSLVLARDGVLSPVFMSVESFLGRHTLEYYRVLGDVGGGKWQPDRASRTWVDFMLKAHFNQAQIMLQRITESGQMWDALEAIAKEFKLAGRMVFAMFDAAMGYRVRRATYRHGLGEDDLSDQTATRDLRKLCENELLIPKGERRGRFYLSGPRIRELTNEIVVPQHELDSIDPFTNLDSHPPSSADRMPKRSPHPPHL